MFEPFGSVRIITNINLTISYDDRSGVRSPSRAIRRQKRGFRQNTRRRWKPDPSAYEMNGCLHMHPETLREFEYQLATRTAGGPDDR